MASKTRRSFLKSVTAAGTSAAALGAVAKARVQEARILEPTIEVPEPAGPNDRIRFATIGMGIIGFIDTDTALRVPGVEFVAASDIYEGRRVHTREIYGDQVDVTVDYREILDRDDIDAVLLCVPDHWHAAMSIEAMKAGKAVYCEKPMVQRVEQGDQVIGAQEETGAVFQVGSQYASSILYDKVKERIASGAIGRVNMVEARYNRNSSLGAWRYSIPLDASPETVDWDRFLGPAPDRPFDAERVFRWRNFWDYGTAVAGDLFVHLFTGIHHAVGTLGPSAISAMGGRRYWDDGREVYDIILGLFDYEDQPEAPGFTLALQTNFEDGGGPSQFFRFVGDEGVIEVGYRDLTVRNIGIHEHTPEEVLQGYNSVRTFSEEQQRAYARHYRERDEPPDPSAREVASERFALPGDYDDRFDHFIRFFDSVRNGTPVYEDAVFGQRAAAPALLSNVSYLEGRRIGWDPEAMRLKG